jgi:hypothetical protein
MSDEETQSAYKEAWEQNVSLPYPEREYATKSDLAWRESAQNSCVRPVNTTPPPRGREQPRGAPPIKFEPRPVSRHPAQAQRQRLARNRFGSRSELNRFHRREGLDVQSTTSSAC